MPLEELFGGQRDFGVAARLAFSSADNKFEIYVVEGALGIDIDDIREADLRNWEVSFVVTVTGKILKFGNVQIVAQLIFVLVRL